MQIQGLMENVDVAQDSDYSTHALPACLNRPGCEAKQQTNSKAYGSSVWHAMCFIGQS